MSLRSDFTAPAALPASSAFFGRMVRPYMSVTRMMYCVPATSAACFTAGALTPIQLGTSTSPGRGVFTESS